MELIAFEIVSPFLLISSLIPTKNCPLVIGVHLSVYDGYCCILEREHSFGRLEIWVLVFSLF